MPSTASSSLVGRRVDGRYQVLHHLDDGGMGSVYVALDERLDRHVALKIMRPDLARDEQFVERFRQEARSAARLSHPNIVAVTDQGQDEHYVFIAMELVEGTTLRELIRTTSPMSVRRVLQIAEGILAALAVAHSRGIVHRDIKPENVLLRDDGTVKVVDFGLARAVTTRTASADSSVIFGTAAYLSPEQVETGRSSERSDVYSVGLLIFEMLTGNKAFPGDSPIHVAYQHVHGTVPTASQTVPTVPAAVDALIEDATATDPLQRPADAAELLEELNAIRAGLTDDQLDAAPVGPASGQSDHPAHTSRLGIDATHALVEPTDAPASPQRRRSILLGLVALLAVALIATGGWLFTLGPLGQTSVPDVLGRPQGQAISLIRAQHLDTSVTQAFSEKVPVGDVIASKPTPGAQVRKSADITLTVSRGPERHTVPTLDGKTQEQAQTALSAATLRVGTVTQAYDDTVPAGEVVSSNPAATSSLKRGAAVALTISMGREPIAVPAVTGQTVAAATGVLDRSGFTVTKAADEFSDTVPAGKVISQTPADGTGFRGDTVTLTVSKGPELITVPDVTGKPTAKAKSALEALGLTVKVRRYFGGLFDTVRATDPSAGTKVRKGSSVTLSVV
ncbi:MAG: Stk1 family PASTA domain-containing Ser/Thr kinase [Allobranchiibius sp.]